MKTKLFFIAIATISLGLFSCSSGNSKKSEEKKVETSDNSRNSLDWNGTYTGTVPCADCQGIFTIVTLNKDNTYTLSMKYLGKSGEYFDSHGNFTWNDAGSSITFEGINDNEGFKMYQVGENKLTMLDIQGNIITGSLADKYILKKVKDDIVEKYWKLKELNGEEIKWAGIEGREPHIILKIDENRVAGSGGCNNIMGTYEIKENDKITFSRMASTMMACPDMKTESAFLKSIETIDNYVIKGDNLILRDINNNDIAKFEVVYL